METPKDINHCVASVAWSLSVFASVFFFLLSPAQVSPAQAKVLHGHLEKIKIGPDTEVDGPENPNSQPAHRNRGQAGSSSAGQQPVIQQQVQPVKLLEAGILNNTFPRSFEGSWKCETLVTESGVDTVPAGSKLISDVQFARLADGRIVARWNQPGWTETQANATTFNAKEARVDRTSYYYGEGINGAWAARSRDHFVQINADQIAVKSYVDQYIDGQYVGRYRTASVLHRIQKRPELADCFQGQ